MMRTPNRSRQARPALPHSASGNRSDLVNSLGYLRVMFAVGDIDDTLDGLATTVRISSAARWCSTSPLIGFATFGEPEGVLIGLGQEFGTS